MYRAGKLNSLQQRKINAFPIKQANVMFNFSVPQPTRLLDASLQKFRSSPAGCWDERIRSQCKRLCLHCFPQFASCHVVVAQLAETLMFRPCPKTLLHRFLCLCRGFEAIRGDFISGGFGSTCFVMIFFSLSHSLLRIARLQARRYRSWN